MQSLVLVGAGGHAKVVLSLARAAGYDVIGVCDPALAASGATEWRGLPVLGSDEALAWLDRQTVGIAIGLGQMPHSTTRTVLFTRLEANGFRIPRLVHPSAIVDGSTVIAEGAQVMAGVVLQADCRIGRDSTINTGARVDHDCEIGAHVHVAPGATLCGGVAVGDGAFIGSGATVIQQTTIGANAIVGAGVTLRHPLNAGRTYVEHEAPH